MVSHPHTATHHFTTTHSSCSGAAATRTRLGASTTIISRPHVLVRLEQNEINFRGEETSKHHRCTDVEAHAQTRRLNLVVGARAEVNGNRCEEHNAGRVHCKANVFRFVEVFWDLSRFKSVNGAERNKKDNEDERNHETVTGTFAGQHCLQGRRVNLPDIGRVINQPSN